jgi:hypothetical protein
VLSCKKDDDNDDVIPSTPPPVSYPDYMQLKVGNYWIYEKFDIDATGNAAATGILDSCYIEKDTLINGNTYFKFKRPNAIDIYSVTEYLRDSLSYVVDQNGSIVFSSQDYWSLFADSYHIFSSDTIYHAVRQMADINATTVVPYGALTTLNCKTTYYMYGGWAANGAERVMSKKYAQGVGLVLETLVFFASSPQYSERRLVRYHLN